MSWWQRWLENYVKGSFVDDLLSEKEQIEQFRAWWREYGMYIIGGVVIGTGMLFGINQYQKSKLEGQLAGSAAYELLVGHVSDGDLDDAEITANEITTRYAETTYAGQAGLAMARLYMDKNRDQDAADALLAVVNSDADRELKHVARLRLARIYLYQDKAQEVVDLLAAENSSAFAATYGEVLGDAYTALGQVAEAQAVYQKVLLDPLAQGTVDLQLVQWKALDLPEVAVDSEPVPAPAVEVIEPESEEVE